jgi:zinc protease
MLMLPVALLLSSLSPAPGAAHDGSLPALRVGPHRFHRRLLSNGLRCVAVRDEEELVSVFVVLAVGKRDESEETTGIAHLVEHAMFAGTEKTGKDAHEALVRAMGGEANAFTREDYTLYYDHRVPAESLSRVLALEADRLRGLRFEEEAFLHERGRLTREEALTHRPTDARLEELEARVYRVHPYRAGLRDTAGHTRAPGIDAAAARAFYDRHYHPRRACVVVVGALEPEEMLDRVEEAFGGLPPGPALPPPPTEPWIATPRRETIPSALPRDRVELVWLVPPVGDSSAPALELLARWLGRARLEDGTPVEAVLEERFDRRLFRLAASGEEVARELAALVATARSEPAPEQELELLRSLARETFTSLPLRARPYFSLAATLGVHEAHGRAQELAEWADAVALLTPLDLQAAAARWLAPQRCVEVVFEGTGEPVEPLPDEPDALARAAQDALDAGDHQRAIDAYTKLLAGRQSRMNTVIYLTERGSIHLALRDHDAAIADFERALAVVDYPAVRTLLEEAHARKRAALRGEFSEESGGGD